MALKFQGSEAFYRRGVAHVIVGRDVQVRPFRAGQTIADLMGDSIYLQGVVFTSRLLKTPRRRVRP